MIWEGVNMLNKLSGLARSLYIILAIVAGFVAMGGMNVALVLLVLGLIAGITLPRDRLVLAAVSIVALPVIGTALTNIPAIGAQLNAVTTNLALGICGAAATAIAMFLYDLVMDGVSGLMGNAGGRAAATAAE
jgi:hypothetical protein